MDEAVECYRRAISFNPNLPEAHVSLGNVLQELGQLDEAIACQRKALDLNPDLPEALNELVYQSMNACVWDGIGLLQEKLIVTAKSSFGRVEPYTLLGMPSTLADQQICARHFGEKYRVPSDAIFHHTFMPRHNKIRIGYLSNSFCIHAQAFLITELIERHDRSRFNVLLIPMALMITAQYALA